MNAKPLEAGHEHLVQFYGGDDARLGRNVARFLNESLRSGGGALVVASPARCEAIGRELGSERAVFLDSNETLAKLLGNDGRPDPVLFDACAGALARELSEKYGSFRAYGEMVGILWSKKSFSAAIALESLWNDLIDSVGFDLFCGYPIDVLGEEFQLACVQPLLDSHTRVVPAVAHSFDIAMRRAMDDVLGDRGDGLRSLRAEQLILRLRSTLPRYADGILAKAQEYFQA
ncbi:MAG: MEDS domain-containing protein [Candidatus Cybelea sp.]|jgi:hypothetical protein